MVKRRKMKRIRASKVRYAGYKKGKSRKGKVLRMGYGIYKQHGGKPKSLAKDRKRLAKPVGWRFASASGKRYWESRQNRSDRSKSRKL